MKATLELGTNVTIHNHTFPSMTGGFGENQRCITLRDIASIHEREFKHLNQLMNSNISRFIENLDYLDLKSEASVAAMIFDSLPEKDKQYWSRYQTYYILSERGYMKLTKLMNDDKSWEIMNELLDQYFYLKDLVQSQIPRRDQLALQILNSDSYDIKLQSLREYKDEIEKPLKEEIQLNQSLIESLTDDIPMVTRRQFLNDIIRAKGPSKTGIRWKYLYDEYERVANKNIDTRLKRVNEGRKYPISKLDYIEYTLGEFELLYSIALKLFKTDFEKKLRKYTEAL